MKDFLPKTAEKVVSPEALRQRIYRAKKKKDQQQKKSISTRKAAYRARMSVDQRESHNNKNRQAKRHKRASLSHAEREVINNGVLASRAKRRKLTGYSEKYTSTRDSDCHPDDKTIDECKLEALKILHRTILADKEGWHKYPVCVICDCFIIGIEEVKSLNRKQLLVHEDRLSVKKYEDFNYQHPIPKDLRKYYHLPGFPKMLLSPRATKEKKDTLAVKHVTVQWHPGLKTRQFQNILVQMGFSLENFQY